MNEIISLVYFSILMLLCQKTVAYDTQYSFERKIKEDIKILKNNLTNLLDDFTYLMEYRHNSTRIKYGNKDTKNFECLKQKTLNQYLMNDNQDYRIYSRNNPKNYPENFSCRIVLNVDKSQNGYVELKFEYFNIEYSSDCNYDHLIISDDKQSIALCGDGLVNNLNKTLNPNEDDSLFLLNGTQPYVDKTYTIRPTGSIIFQFKSDKKLTAPGFVINIRFKTEKQPKHTRQTKNNYMLPSYFAAGVNLRTSEVFNIISKGQDSEWDSPMLCELHSGETINLDCSGRSYEILTRNPYRPGTQCGISLQTPRGQAGIMIFAFKYIQTEVSDNCQYDYIKIQNEEMKFTICGKENKLHLRGKGESEFQTNQNYFINVENSAKLEFRSDESSEYAGFHLQLSFHCKNNTKLVPLNI
ncbi:DgyrCDS14795 [Dimorphilus gyrociliatus]|uniref:DgyrCDS14795 n=1 Tax=Dimorphilus gyrociliatus TaxID=2664684 RepID=A0A7I8WF42_9ANNE|nr:DgyrCDS14795 [Dimorphilus gyrociliatus]